MIADFRQVHISVFLALFCATLFLYLSAFVMYLRLSLYVTNKQMNECIERSLSTGEASSMSAAPAPVENADVDDVYFQNGLLKANVSWTVANGDVFSITLYF